MVWGGVMGEERREGVERGRRRWGERWRVRRAMRPAIVVVGREGRGNEKERREGD